MLKTGGYINIIIGIGHVIGLFWAEEMFEVTGIGKEMSELSATHSSLPYLLTVFAAIMFVIFGLYGLSADDKIRELPFLKSVVFTISGIFIFRGLGELIFNTIQGMNTIAASINSLVAFAVGLLFLIGGLKKWKSKIE